MNHFVVLVCNGTQFEVWADGMTRRRKDIYFWMKREHWWHLRRRCVAVVDWKVVAGVWEAKPKQTSAEIAKELGVKL